VATATTTSSNNNDKADIVTAIKIRHCAALEVANTAVHAVHFVSDQSVEIKPEAVCFRIARAPVRACPDEAISSGELSTSTL